MNTWVPIDLSVELGLNKILIKGTLYVINTLGPLDLSVELSTQYHVNGTRKDSRYTRLFLFICMWNSA